MPTYEYECLRCGHKFEEFQEITARPRSRCPQCRGKVRRLISAGAGIVFKGSGWYSTDSRRSAANGPAPEKPAEGAAAEKPTAAEATKSAAADAAKSAKAGASRGRGRGKSSGSS